MHQPNFNGQSSNEVEIKNASDGTPSAENNDKNQNTNDMEKENKITNINELIKETFKSKLSKPSSSTLTSRINIPPEKIKAELNKYCRACADIKRPLIDIFSEEGCQMKLNLQMEYLYKITKDSSPYHLCIDCICELRASYRFLIKVKETDQKFNELSDMLSPAEKTRQLKKLKKDALKKFNKTSPRVFDNLNVYSSRNNNKTELDPKNLDCPSRVIEKECKIILNRLNLENGHKVVDNKSYELEFVNNNVDLSHRKTVPNNLTEDSQQSRKLKNILQSTSDAAIRDFQKFLTKSDIVLAELTVGDIIRLYETKNVITIDGGDEVESAIQETTFREEPERYNCDFCLESFSTKILETEHSRVHDFAFHFPCDYCQKGFESMEEKCGHVSMCDSKLACKFCCKVFGSMTDRSIHERKHLKTSHTWICDRCGVIFAGKKRLDIHYRVKHTKIDKVFSCSMCQRKFIEKTYLNLHVKKIHPEVLELKKGLKAQCLICRKLVLTRNMPIHMRCHGSPLSYKCPKCHKIFNRSSSLKQHLIIHEDLKRYKCAKCDSQFKRRSTIVAHMRSHDKLCSKTKKRFTCEVCKEKFPNLSKFVIHRNRAHRGNKHSFVCQICNRSLQSQSSLDWHLSLSHESSECEISCCYCGMKCKTESSFGKHLTNEHMENGVIKCHDCKLEFQSEARVRQHMMIKHERYEGTLKCTKCPKRFVGRNRLRLHLKSHSECRPFSCELCKLNFKKKSHLIQHRQNKHSNVKKLQCKFCTFKCKQVSSMTLHERTHTNQRPYSCQVCKQLFKSLGDKNKHERRHTSLGGPGFKRAVKQFNKNDFVRYEDSDLTELETRKRTLSNVINDEVIGKPVSQSKKLKISRPVLSAMEKKVDLLYEDANNFQKTNLPGIIVHVQQESMDGDVRIIPVLLSMQGV